MADNFAILHAHSYFSLLDSPLSIKDLVSGAKEAGACAVALTDHGSCMGWVEFLKCCGKEGIKGIPGTEAYVRTPFAGRAHLVLLAKNREGYKEISRFISDGYRTQERLYKDVYVPVTDMSLLGEYFGHGNVIATTACIAGPLGSVRLGQEKARAAIAKEQAKIDECLSPDSPKFRETSDRKDALDFEVAGLMERRDALKKTAEKKYTARLKGLSRLSGEAYSAAKERIEREMAETEAAAAELEAVKKKLAAKKAARTRAGRELKDLRQSVEKRLRLEEKASGLKDSLMSDWQIREESRKMLKSLLGVFGDDLYAEVQYHGIPSERIIYPETAMLARELNIPLIAANDVHIKDASQVQTRQMMRAMRFNSWQDAEESDAELGIKTRSGLGQALSQILPDDCVREALDNTARAAARCSVSLPEGNHYPVFRAGADAGALLREKTMDGAARIFPDGLPEGYGERLEYELATIHEMGYDDYMLIVEDSVRFARELAENNDPEGVGYGAGPGRGSAVGSLAAYMLGITKVDPVKYGLLFERFLNKDRVSSPDIDLDMSYEVREASIAHAKERYGDDCVSAIRTAVRQGAKASVKNSARVLGYEKYPMAYSEDRPAAEEGRRRLSALADAICGEIPDAPGTCLAPLMDGLLRKFTSDDGQTVLRRAADAEGAVVSTGVHPAGILISDGVPLAEYTPLSFDRKEKKWCAQCDMTEAEEIGLLKMDFLGVNTLDIITECIRRVNRELHVRIDPDSLPFEPEVFRDVYAAGNTSCVFQVESNGMRNMLRKLRPECFEDVILAISVFRPGPMDFIPDIIAVKDGKEKPKYAVPELGEILDVTYGKPIYQEQLMQIFSRCAGFTLEEADIVRRAMAKKKEKDFLARKDRFIGGICARGSAPGDAEELWDSLVDFAKYAFNKSHAAAYALVSYQTAWLKYHHPTQFMAAVLNHPREASKLPGFLDECRAMGIKILRPDINLSMKTFEQDGGIIRFGLGGIKGVDTWADGIIAERQEHGIFKDLTDFIRRWNGNGAVIRSLILAGAFDGAYAAKVPEINGNPGTIRGELLSYYENSAPWIKKMRAKERALTELAALLSEARGKEARRIELRIEGAKEAIKDCLYETDGEQINVLRTDRPGEATGWERELLGAYVSAHPLDAYRGLYGGGGITRIADAEDGYAVILGAASSVRETKRKSDGAKMAFFTLEDTSGAIAAACFAKEYAELGDAIRDGAVLKVSGKIGNSRGYGGERQIVVRRAEPAAGDEKYVVVSAPDRETFEAALPALLAEKGDGSGRLLFLDRSDGSGHLTDTGLRVQFEDARRIRKDAGKGGE